MTEKNIGLDCHDCDGSYMVSVRKAKKHECPNCMSGNVVLLDELPEENYQ